MSAVKFFLSLAAAACMSLALSACSSRQTDYYMLNSEPSALNMDHMPRTTMVVDEIAMPGYLDRNNIVVRDAGGSHLAVANFNIWAEPLQHGMQRVLAEQLTEPLLGAGVTVLPYQSNAVAAAYALHIELLRLDADRNGHVAMESRWTLIDVRGNRVVDRGSFASTETVDMPVFGSREMFTTIVAAESRLVRQFGDRLAAVLPGTLRRTK